VTINPEGNVENCATIVVQEEEEEEDGLKKARRFNALAKVVYILLVIAFNVIFWSISLVEYHRKGEEILAEYSSGFHIEE